MRVPRGLAGMARRRLEGGGAPVGWGWRRAGGLGLEAHRDSEMQGGDALCGGGAGAARCKAAARCGS